MRRTWVPALSLAGACLTACSGSDVGCSDVGGINGVSVELAPALFVAEGSVDFEVCDDEGCETATKKLGHLDQRVGRGSTADFEALGRAFDAGSVSVTVELRGEDGAVVARKTADVELERYYPNGEECDGDGYVSGGLVMGRADRA